MPAYVCDVCEKVLGDDLAVIHNGSLMHVKCKPDGRVIAAVPEHGRAIKRSRHPGWARDGDDAA
jgi:hypothetical protein